MHHHYILLAVIAPFVIGFLWAFRHRLSPPDDPYIPEHEYDAFIRANELARDRAQLRKALNLPPLTDLPLEEDPILLDDPVWGWGPKEKP